MALIDWNRQSDRELVIGLGAAAVVILVCISIGVALVKQSAREREWIEAGYCTKVTEHLYQPAPSYHETCHGEGASRRCSGYYTEADPYMRSLWRCRVPQKSDLGDTTGHYVEEFWRRTAEEFE